MAQRAPPDALAPARRLARDSRAMPEGVYATRAPSGRRAFAWGLVALALAGGALRLALAERVHPVRLVGDEVYYAQVAAHLASGEGHLYVGALEGEARAWRPPAHPFALSLLLDPERARRADAASDPEQLRTLVRLQVLVGALLVAATALLAAALFDARTGLLAAALAAAYPALVAQSHMLWSEGLFSLAVTLALAAAVRAERSPSPAWVAAAGLGFGIAALARELALGAALAATAWWVARAPRGAGRAAAGRAVLALALVALVVAPWTLRNARVLGRFVPVSTIGWFAAAEGNSLEHPDWLRAGGPEEGRFHAAYFTRRDEVARLDFARAHALERIRAEQPAWILRKTVRNLALLLSPDEVLRTKVRRGAYGDLPPPEIRLLLAAAAPAWIALYTAAALGIAGARENGRRLLALFVLALVAAAHVAANATPRFRLPWLPLLLAYASHALLCGRGLAGRIDRAGAIGAAAALLLLFAVCLPYYAVYGGRH
jgi:4-amino-4-deoxy-L-arabinose transferase-like glycosyltransferase